MEKEPVAGITMLSGCSMLHKIEIARAFSTPMQGSPKTELSARIVHEVCPRHAAATMEGAPSAWHDELA